MPPVPIAGFYSSNLYTNYPSTSIILPYSQGGPEMSLGGAASPRPMPPYISPFQMVPAYNGYPSLAPYTDHILFADTTSAQRTAGRTTYKGVFFRALEDIEDLSFYLQAPSIGTFASQVGTLDAQNHITPIADETTSPGGSFSTPSSGSPTSIGDVEAGDYIFLWFRRVISAGAAAKGWDRMSVVFTATDLTPRIFNFYHHLLAEQTITSVSGARNPGSIHQQDGELFYVVTTGDPADNLVYVSITGGGIMQFGQPQDTPLVTQMIDKAARQSSTSYKYWWRPTSAGYYRLHFFTAESSHILDRYVQA